MAFKIVYKKSVFRDLKKISKVEAGRILDQIEETLQKNPESFPMLTGKFAGFRKFRVGDNRVVYILMGEDIIILRNGHRKDVYKKETLSG